MGKERWLEGLSRVECRVGRVLLSAEEDLSDGYGFYGDIKTFQKIVKRLILAVRKGDE